MIRREQSGDDGEGDPGTECDVGPGEPKTRRAFQGERAAQQRGEVQRELFRNEEPVEIE
jgi:hypothetical protein